VDDDEDDFNSGRIENDRELDEIDIAGPSSPQKQENAKKTFNDTLKTIREEEIEETMKAKANEPVVDRDDFEDSGEEEEKEIRPADKNFTFMGEEGAMKNDILSKFNNVEQIREYLENKLGEDTMIRAYPILQDFGDDIFFEEKVESMVKKLDGIMTKKQFLDNQ